MSKEKFNRLINREKQNNPVTIPLPKLAPYAKLYSPEQRVEFLNEFDRKIDEWRKALLWERSHTVVTQEGGDTIIVNESSGGGSPSSPSTSEPAFPVLDDLFEVQNAADNSKSLKLDLSLIASGEQRTIIIPDSDGTLPLLELDQTWTGDQTFSAPVVIALGAIVNPASILELTAEWNDAADIFEGVIIDVTNTASNALSLPFEVRIGGQGYFHVKANGDVEIFNGDGALFSGNKLDIGSGEIILGAQALNFSGPGGGSVTMFDTDVSAFTIQIGNALTEYGNGYNLVFGTGSGSQIATGATQKISFWGATPIARPAAFVQTYSTASRTLAAYTADPESAVFIGIDNLQAGTPYATVADLNQLRVAYETLRVFAENVGQVLNALIDDHQAAGLCAP